MNYADHERLVCVWGVELIGWTEPKIINPTHITTSHALNRLLQALRNGDCHWVVLEAPEWDARKKARAATIAAGLGQKRAARKDAGQSRKRQRTDNSDEEEEHEEGDDDMLSD